MTRLMGEARTRFAEMRGGDDGRRGDWRAIQEIMTELGRDFAGSLASVASLNQRTAESIGSMLPSRAARRLEIRMLEQGYGARWLYALARYIRGRRIEDKGGYAVRALSAPEEFDECVQRVLAESDASPKNDQRNPAAATLGSHKQTTRKQRKKRGGAAHAEREREEKRRRLARARKEQERMDRATTYDNVTDYLREEAE